jgi:hypothetical protein
MHVLAEGKRGPGHLVLGKPGSKPDLRSPLPHVVAYGSVHAGSGESSVVVRELVGEQLDVEIIPSCEAEALPDIEIRDGWTYSSWRPGLPSPCAGDPVRQIQIDTNVWLVVAGVDRRLWVYDIRTGMNIPVPITAFHAELMSVRKIRDPHIVLQPASFFSEQTRYSDEDLRLAFLNYNRVYRKTDTESKASPDSALKQAVRRLLTPLLKR